jgi:hypothetical protein
MPTAFQLRSLRKEDSGPRLQLPTHNQTYVRTLPRPEDRCSPCNRSDNRTFPVRILPARLFDRSLTPDRYYHSEGSVSAPSSLLLDRAKIPVDRTTFFTPPNALRLQ